MCYLHVKNPCTLLNYGEWYLSLDGGAVTKVADCRSWGPSSLTVLQTWPRGDRRDGPAPPLATPRRPRLGRSLPRVGPAAPPPALWAWSRRPGAALHCVAGPAPTQARLAVRTNPLKFPPHDSKYSATGLTTEIWPFESPWFLSRWHQDQSRTGTSTGVKGFSPLPEDLTLPCSIQTNGARSFKS